MHIKKNIFTLFNKHFTISLIGIVIVSSTTFFSCQSVNTQPPSSASSFRKAGGLIFLSGHLAVTSSNGIYKVTPGLDFEGQIKKIMEVISKDLESVNLTMNDIISATIYLKDMNNISRMNTVYRSYFSEPFPARTTVGVNDLLGGADIEISVIAKDHK